MLPASVLEMRINPQGKMQLSATNPTKFTHQVIKNELLIYRGGVFQGRTSKCCFYWAVTTSFIPN